MASGKKNYFRHSFSARNDDKIQDVVDKFGLAGYYYYFALVEICAEQSAEIMPDKFVFHQRTLIKELRCHKNKLRVLLEYFANISLISYTYTENRVEVSIPKLSKYMGYYTNKKETNTPKESKEKEKKVKKRETARKCFLTDELLDSIYVDYPVKKGKANGYKTLKGKIKNNDQLTDLKKAVGNYVAEVEIDKTDKKYIKHFSTFANCYEDYIKSQAMEEKKDLQNKLENLLTGKFDENSLPN